MNTESTIINADISDVSEFLNSGPKQSWVNVASLLLRVEQSGSWHNDYSSFAVCLRDIANGLNLKESMLWRYRRAALFYSRFFDDKKMPKLINLPSLENLQDISPDNIDLLDKLSRVLPENELILLMVKVISKQVGRRELREKWQTLREELLGRTARGKGVVTPKLARKDSHLSIKYLEDKTLSYLQEIGPSWLGVNSANRYHILRSSSMVFLYKYDVDAVAVVQKSNSNILEYHGIAIKNRVDRTLANYLPKEQYFDSTWLVCNTIGLDLPINEVPQHLSIISVDDSMVTLVRPGIPSAETASQKLSLMNDIIFQLLPK